MKETNEEQYFEENRKTARLYANTLVLDVHDRRILKLLSFGEDKDDPLDDYYWTFLNEKGNIEKRSCLIGHWTPLKGKIDDKEYEHMVEGWNKECENKKAR